MKLSYKVKRYQGRRKFKRYYLTVGRLEIQWTYKYFELKYNGWLDKR